ncbi:MAG TPA: phosphoglucosamine mutase [Pirellulaceae bacterium]|nr:phosphoglucosamine mutase [Pirellulaceae bacterium]
MPEPIISVSGLRGIVGKSLTPDVAMRFVAAFAAGLPEGSIVVSHDGRTTGPMLANAVRSALCAVGRHVFDAGIQATPTVGLLVRAEKAVGGVQISASHNPPEYNGLKLFSAEGRVISAAAGNEVIEHYRHGDAAWATHERVGQIGVIAHPALAHLRALAAIVDVKKIQKRAFRVILDSNHGAGGVLGQVMLADFGCKATVLAEKPTGLFVHPPEPCAENLAGVLSRVVEAGADVGFCQDPDADRLAIIDEKGRYIGEEYTLALCLDHVLTKLKGTVVTNCSTSRICEDIARKHGSRLVHSAVGEANVCDLMLAEKAVFGGEGNGGPIDPRVGYVRDSFVGMALVLEGLATRGGTLSDWVDSLPKYAIHKSKLALAADRVPALLDALEKKYTGAKFSRRDGLRIDWPDDQAWLLVRASNTEPIVRAIAEAPELAHAQKLCEAVAELAR